MIPSTDTLTWLLLRRLFARYGDHVTVLNLVSHKSVPSAHAHGGTAGIKFNRWFLFMTQVRQMEKKPRESFLASVSVGITRPSSLFT